MVDAAKELVSVSLGSLIEAGADAGAIAAYLDGLEESRRVHEVKSLKRWHLAKLWTLIQTSAPLELAAMVPEAEKEQVWVGRNSMPLFTTVEKHFYRAKSGTICGFNEQPFRWFTGPGYFVARDVPDKGQVDFDYTAPVTEVVPGWPPIRSNTGFYSLVFGGLLDVNRRVSRDTLLGHAYKYGVDSAYFIITRTTRP
jgi:hypothetical protein